VTSATPLNANCLAPNLTILGGREQVILAIDRGSDCVGDRDTAPTDLDSLAAIELDQLCSGTTAPATRSMGDNSHSELHKGLSNETQSPPSNESDGVV
jgi:hypothetical protein